MESNSEAQFCKKVALEILFIGAWKICKFLIPRDRCDGNRFAEWDSGQPW